MRSLYPPEAVVFEIIDSDGRIVPNGTIVEGLGTVENDGVYHLRAIPGAIALRIVDDQDFHGHAQYAILCMRQLGFLGMVLFPRALRPLTRAAREMLALVSGGAA